MRHSSSGAGQPSDARRGGLCHKASGALLGSWCLYGVPERVVMDAWRRTRLDLGWPWSGCSTARSPRPDGSADQQQPGGSGWLLAAREFLGGGHVPGDERLTAEVDGDRVPQDVVIGVVENLLDHQAGSHRAPPPGRDDRGRRAAPGPCRACGEEGRDDGRGSAVGITGQDRVRRGELEASATHAVKQWAAPRAGRDPLYRFLVSRVPSGVRR